MDLYTKVAYDHARSLTLNYSSSFGISSRLFAKKFRAHIYAVYGLVRIADEIVDTYKGANAGKMLDDLEEETFRAIETRYSANPIVHAFALTARQYDIDASIIKPFFASMKLDLRPQDYTEDLYATYIHGSAEVVGLMCLKVFTEGDKKMYTALRNGACALGAAYQKINFLRDLAHDYHELGRIYFPGCTFETFDESAKQHVCDDIERDLANALVAIHQLPISSRLAVKTSYAYYAALFAKLRVKPAETIKASRLRIPTVTKLLLLKRTIITELVIKK